MVSATSGKGTTRQAEIDLQEDDLRMTLDMPFSSNESTWGATCCHNLCSSLLWWRGLRESDLEQLQRRQKARRSHAHATFFISHLSD